MYTKLQYMILVYTERYNSSQKLQFSNEAVAMRIILLLFVNRTFKSFDIKGVKYEL